MSAGTLAGTAALTRAAVRRDRVRILVWVGSIVALVVVSALSTKGLYGTPESLAQAAAFEGTNKAAIVFNGPPLALDTVGGQVAFQVSSFGLVVVGLMSIFMLGRLTRADEENGRTELLLATPVGRHAPLAAALIVVTALNVVVGVLCTAGLLASGLPAVGSIAFGVGFIALGLVFAGVTALAAQVTENTRVVYGSGGALLGLAFLLRGLGDTGDGSLSWLSPIGWSQKMRPYAGEAWWALVVPVVATAGLVAGAWALAARRDVGAGLVAPRPGRPGASPSLGSPLGLALRLQRGGIIGWTAGMVLLGVSYGSLANDIQQFVTDNQQMKDFLTGGRQGDILNLFFATATMMLALISSGFAVQATLRLGTEEAALRAEPLLATPVSRARWVASHLTVAALGSAVVVGVTGLGMAVTYGLTIGDFSSVPRLVGASLTYLPAVWVLVGVAMALFGLAPRLVAAAWGVFGLVALVGILGDLLRLPDWVRALSPFKHVPQMPADDFRALPVLVLAALAAGLVAAGTAGFGRRDTPA
jgi:ABC-2 type transport system permease protein